MNQSPSSPPSRSFPGLLFALVVLAAAVRWTVIGRDTLWLDEGYSWWDAQQRFGALWDLVPTCDPHPPLYFALLHVWTAVVGDGTVAMRLLSTLFGIVTVVLVYASGRELDRARGGDRERFGIGAVAALLFLLTPFQVYFSIEARPYALLCFGAALLTFACLAVVRGVQSGERRLAFAWTDRVDPRHGLALLLGAVIVVWTNNTAVLNLGAVSIAFVALWASDRDSRSIVVPVVATGVLVAILWAPDWPVLVAQAREVTEDFWIQPPSLEGIQFELHNLIGLDILRWTWWFALAIGGGLSLVWRRIGWRWGLMLTSLAILPIALNIGISYLVKPILISRALIGAAPALAIALASSAMLLRPRALRVAVVVVLIGAHGYALSRFLGADHVKEPWGPVVARLQATAPHAPVLVVPNELALPLGHEAKMQHVDVRVIGLPADYPAVGLPIRYPSGKCAPSVVGQDLSPILRSLRDEPVVVLLTRRNNTYDPKEASLAAMRDAGYVLAGEDVYQPGDLRILRYARSPS